MIEYHIRNAHIVLQFSVSFISICHVYKHSLILSLISLIHPIGKLQPDLILSVSVIELEKKKLITEMNHISF